MKLFKKKDIDYKSKNGNIDLFIVLVIIIAFFAFFIFIFLMLTVLTLNDLKSLHKDEVEKAINEQNSKNLDLLFSLIGAIGSAATGIGFFMLVLQAKISSKELVISRNVARLAHEEYTNSLKPYLGLNQEHPVTSDDVKHEYRFNVKNYGQTPAFANIMKLVWGKDKKITKETLVSNNISNEYEVIHPTNTILNSFYPDDARIVGFKLKPKDAGYFGLYIRYKYLTDYTGDYGIILLYDKDSKGSEYRTIEEFIGDIYDPDKT